MAAKCMEFLMVTPEKVLFQKQVVSLVVPTNDGFRGILADHAPFAGTIVPGPITVHMTPDSVETIPCTSHGFIEVRDNKVAVLLHKT